VEWVEVTGKTVGAAKEAALDQLGVDDSDAEFEVLEEPKAGLFGLLRSEARVRARVVPATARPKVERRDRKRRERPNNKRAGDRDKSAAADAGGAAGAAAAAPPTAGGRRNPAGEARRPRQPAVQPSVQTQEPQVARQQGARMADGDDGADAGELAEEFVDGLLNSFGATYQVARRDLDDDTVEIAVSGDDLGLLIGPRGQTLAAVQELARTVVQRRGFGTRTRVMVDIAGYRMARREALERFTRGVAEQVKASGVARVLEPMTAPDRKVVHDTVNTIDGVATTSEGEEPGRRVLIVPDADEADEAGSPDGA
jgi:spoIIIJ-associated protein